MHTICTQPHDLGTQPHDLGTQHLSKNTAKNKNPAKTLIIASSRDLRGAVAAFLFPSSGRLFSHRRCALQGNPSGARFARPCQSWLTCAELCLPMGSRNLRTRCLNQK